MDNAIVEAAEYVDNVLNTSQATPVPGNQVHVSPEVSRDSGRKRPLSGEVNSQPKRSGAKKLKGDQKGGENGVGTVDLTNLIQQEGDNQNVNSVDLCSALSVIFKELQHLSSSLNERMDSMETNLEKRISARLAQTIDKRVVAEASKLRREVDNRISSLRDDFNTDLVGIGSKVERLEEVVDAGRQEKDLSLNVAIFNLPESPNENLNNKVNGLIKDGLKVRNVTIRTSTRKGTRNHSRSGVVIATFKKAEDKHAIMEAKRRLKESRVYHNVFIQHDQSREERLMAANLRVLVDAVRDGRRDISVRGSRVTAADAGPGRWERRGERPDGNRDGGRRDRNDNSTADRRRAQSHRPRQSVPRTGNRH